MANIVFPDRIDFDHPTLDKLHALGAKLYDDSPANEDELIERVRDAEIIVANFVQITSRVIDAAPNLKFIIVAAAGYDTIDYRYAAAKGIPVLNCPTQNVEAVAEHALTLMLATAHRIVEAATDLRAGKWNGLDLIGTEISRKKLGLVGYGKIGKLIEQKVSGLAMAVTHVDSQSPQEALEQLLRESDIVCLCLTLNESTRDLINKQKLSLLKKDAILINVARGGVVDQAALFKALKQRRVRAAGIDVYQDEPGDTEATQAIIELAKLPNVVTTPHIAYNTEETSRRLGEELVSNIESCLQGKPINTLGGVSVSDKLTTFSNRQITYVETMQVKDGVECDIYTFVGNNTEDLAIVRVTRGYKTPLQMILQGDKTIEGYLDGTGTLTVQNEDGTSKSYSFDAASTDKEVEVQVGQIMQWKAPGGTDLTFYEICQPPYKDGRFENLAEEI